MWDFRCEEGRRDGLETGGAPLRSLLTGVEAAVCDILQVRQLRHRSALLDLGTRDRIAPGSVLAAHARIEQNWHRAHREARGSPSRQNWRWCKPQLRIAQANQSPEIILERAIVRSFHDQCSGRWANQVPVASGVVTPYAERRRAIDLVERRGEEEFAFVELKIESDTPLYAAFEIIFYLCIWLMARADKVAGSPLLAARRIRAAVLAPASYYQGYELEALQTQLAKEVDALGKSQKVDLSFCFERFPTDFIAGKTYDDDALIDMTSRRERL